MVTANGYTLTQYPKNNLIVITLPQTWDTLTNTTGIPRNRRGMLTAEEEAILLSIVMELYEPHKEEQE